MLTFQSFHDKIAGLNQKLADTINKQSNYHTTKTLNQ